MQQKSTRHILSWSELRLAVFFSFVIFLSVFSVFFSGLISSVFQKKIPLTITIEDVGGLRIGAPVWLQGVTVGTVQKIDLTSKSEIIQISINQKYQPFIYKNASAEIKAVGLLGSKYVELLRGKESSGQIQPHQLLKGRLVDPLKSMDENLSMSIRRISTLLDSINRGKGSAGILVNDTSLSSDLKGATANLRSLLEEIRKEPKKYFSVKVF
jgi:phospholipid/cholesterol/gamma-HCH transport system substrate-binding protein